MGVYLMRNDIIKAINTFPSTKMTNSKINIQKAECILHHDERVCFAATASCAITTTKTMKSEKIYDTVFLTDKRFIVYSKTLGLERSFFVDIQNIRWVNCTPSSLSGGKIEIHTDTHTYQVSLKCKRVELQQIYSLFENAKNVAAMNINEPSVVAGVTSSADDEIQSASSLYESTSSQKPGKKKKNALLIILLWIFFLPIMAIITIVKSKKLNKIVKAILIILIIIVFFSSISDDSNTTGTDATNDYTSSSDESVISEADSSVELEKSLFSDIITDDALRIDFLAACELIGMNPDNVNNLEQVDDWASGTRYSFSYSGLAFRLYCNMDSTVNTIKLGSDTDIYKQGYEPYQVADYIIDTDMKVTLKLAAEDAVESQLNYPSTADFGWLDWTYGREGDIYSVSGSVTAKNAFGVEDELTFTLIYERSGETLKSKYFMIDGIVLLNDMDSIVTPERKQLNDTNADASEASDVITLIDGELGQYGKTVTLDGTDYIVYVVPAGTYTITNNGKWSKVYLEKQEYYKNSDGYTENEIVEIISFTEYGETATVTIGNDEQLSMTVSATVSLTVSE